MNDARENPSIKLEWHPDGKLHIVTAGEGITPDRLILGAHYLLRTADDLLDATRQVTAEPRGIVRAASIPEGIQRRD